MPAWRERLTQSRYFYHYLFWGIVVLSYFVDAAALLDVDQAAFFRTMVLKNGLLIAIVYLHLRVLMPVLLARKRYFRYAASLSLVLVFGTGLIHLVETYSWNRVYEHTILVPELPGSREHDGTPLLHDTVKIEEDINVNFNPRNKLLLDALTVCRYLVISVLLKFIDDFFQQRIVLDKIRYEKTAAELNYLKAQINPHFLFNTLNNLYGLILEHSGKAAETALKLSDMMKYLLAESQADRVPLRKDLEHLRNYFDLECLRLPAETDVQFEVAGPVAEQRIAPLLLLPLLENAFKHGVHRGSRDMIFLKTTIEVDGDRLTLEIVNNRPAPDKPAHSLGLGIENVKKRLELFYGGRYSLETGADERQFRTLLRLQMT